MRSTLEQQRLRQRRPPMQPRVWTEFARVPLVVDTVNVGNVPKSVSALFIASAWLTRWSQWVDATLSSNPPYIENKS